MIKKFSAFVLSLAFGAAYGQVVPVLPATSVIANTKSSSAAGIATPLPLPNPCWSVVAATGGGNNQGNIALNGGLQVIDGSSGSATAGNYILLTQQTTQSQNGIWVENAFEWYRPPCYFTGSTTQAYVNLPVWVQGGITNGGTWAHETHSGTIIIDTTVTFWTFAIYEANQFNFLYTGPFPVSALASTSNTITSGSSNTVSSLTTASTIDSWESPTAANKIDIIPACTSLVGGNTYGVIDSQGTAGTYPITIAPLGGYIGIAGSTNYTLTSNYAAALLQCNGGTLTWNVAGTSYPGTNVRYSTTSPLVFAPNDVGGIVVQTDASSWTATLSAINSSGFYPGAYNVILYNAGAGVGTLTPATSTINGASSLSVPSGAAFWIFADNTTSPGNYAAIPWSGALSNSGVTPGSYTSANITVNSEGIVTAASNGSGGSTIEPQGRLTLSSTLPVQNADVTAATTIYYLPYTGANIPVYNGSAFIPQGIGSGISLSTANSTNFPASALMDVYAFMHSGTLTLCATPWGTPTAGSSARGGSAGITQVSGLWVNSGTWSCYAAGTTYTLTTDQATLLGTIAITTTAQQMAFQMQPAAASGGPTGGCWQGYANIYHVVSTSCMALDSVQNFTSTTTGAWEVFHVGGTGSGLYNRVTWVDPLGLSSYRASLQDYFQTGVSGSLAVVAIGVNSITASTGPTAANSVVTHAFEQGTRTAGPSPQAAGGLNYIQALDQGTTGTGSTFYGNSAGATGFQEEMLLLEGSF